MKKLSKQIDFILEIDKLKTVLRRSMITDGSRRENSAEHSWHLCMLAVVLSEYAPEGTDIAHVVKMLLMHDLVEIYAGDTYLYDEEGNKTKAKRENGAADRLYSILDEPQGSELKNLWYEFEKCETNEALFANALDRLQPILLNYTNKGTLWLENNVHKNAVEEHAYRLTRLAHPKLRKFALDLLDKAVEKGYIED
ncbi:MAG: HD domain-containing protein [Firmicutes bacterium]|nr:HD domain-containing protein [Bacillota bacterium]MBQ9605034.1 HD domain-containing protein [Bacillota bacterium]